MVTVCGDRAFVKLGWGLLYSMYLYLMGVEPSDCFYVLAWCRFGAYSCITLVFDYCFLWCYLMLRETKYYNLSSDSAQSFLKTYGTPSTWYQF